MGNVIKIQMTQKQSLLDRLIDKHENVFFGGGKGGGKSVAMRYIMLKRCMQIPNLSAVIFRKTYPELYGNHISKMLSEFPVLKPMYNSSHKEIKFSNGSVLAFRHNQYDRDLGNHQGVEYHYLGIEEAGEWPEEWFWTLKGSNRSSATGIKPRCILTGNPAGIGHKWLKRLFVDRRYRDVEDPDDFEFVPALLKDNPFLLKNDPNYIKRLMANKNKMLVDAYLSGSWDIAAGQFFDSLNRDIHFIDPIEIPDHWRRYGGFDTGFNHPASFGWYAVSEDGVVYKYRELVRAGMRTEQIALEVMGYDDSAKIQQTFAGPDCWNKVAGAPSIAENFAKATNYKISLSPANNDRIQGANQVREYLAPRDGGPLYRIFKTCPISYDCLSRMVHNPNKPEDVLKVDAEGGDPETGDDSYDETRYFLMSRPRASIPVKVEIKDRYARKKRGGTDWKTV